MSEQQTNINPWAEKLQQVSVPEPGGAKRRLFDLLDQEMPMPPKKDKRRWILLLLLLLLLIGVCNCPGLVNRATHTTGNRPGSIHGLPVADNLQKPVYTTNHTALQKTPLASVSQEEPEPGGGSHIAWSNERSKQLSRNKSIVAINSDKQLRIAHPPTHLPKKTNRQHKKRTIANPAVAIQDNEEEIIARSNKEKKAAHPAAENEPESNSVSGTPDSAKSTNTAVGSIAKSSADSTGKKTTKAAGTASKKTTTTIEKGWSLAIGLNQSFPVSGQHRVNAGSDGNTNITGDYIPVPQLRYRFNKKWSVQLELAIHGPQYTQPLRLRAAFDTTGSGGQHYNIYLEKLFYLRAPLSIQYVISKNWGAGAGISYGSLANAIGLFEQRLTRGGRPDSIVYSKTQSLKKDSSGYLYSVLQSRDWQWFTDINYQWKHFSVALRYNHSLGNFINLPVQNAPAAKGINSSLQVSLRYTLWRQKQKKKSSVK